MTSLQASDGKNTLSCRRLASFYQVLIKSKIHPLSERFREWCLGLGTGGNPSIHVAPGAMQTKL